MPETSVPQVPQSSVWRSTDKPFWWPEIQSIIALLLIVTLLVIAVRLVWATPETDMAKIVVGALLTVGFASIIAYYFSSSKGERENQSTITQIATGAVPPTTPAPTNGERK